MTIDDIIKERNVRVDSIMSDWTLAENYWRAKFQIADPDILSGLDPLPTKPVEVEPEPDTSMPSMWQRLTVFCTVCSPTRWKQDITKLRKTILDQLHNKSLADDPETSTNDLIKDLGPFDINSPEFRCRHTHTRAYARVAEPKRVELVNISLSLLRYRQKMRKALKEAAPQFEFDPPRADRVDPEAIRRFEARQSELKVLIEQGDARIRERYKSAEQHVTVDINPADANAQPALVIEQSVRGKLDAELAAWQRDRRGLEQRLWG